jgi:hypothetical protein
MSCDFDRRNPESLGPDPVKSFIEQPGGIQPGGIQPGDNPEEYNPEEYNPEEYNPEE